MNARHIEQHYGFGAARIPIRAEMHRVSEAGFRADFDAILAEAGSGGAGAIARRFAGTSLGVLTIMGFLGLLIVGLARQEAEREALEVVMLQTAPPIMMEEPLVVPPMVEVQPAPPEPIVPEPVVPEPKKPEPPPMVAEVKPPPPPVVPPKIEPVRVKPEIAKVEPPPAPKVERTPRPVREKPAPVARPKVRIEAVAVAPVREAPVAPAERLARANVRPEARTMPRMSAPAAPAIDVPSDAPPERAFRVAAARAPSTPRGRSIAGVAPAGISAPEMDAPSARSAPTRGATVARPTASAAAARSVPRFEMAPAPTGPPSSALEVPQVVARAERAAPPPGSEGGGSAARPGLSGVPLGELQACVTDREEDRLKGAVVAAAKTQGECVSSKGTYRFVETKNVNAFLMWIDRAPSRRVEDRCAELRYALECLQGGGRHASR